MPGLWFFRDDIDRLHQEHAQFLQKQRFVYHQKPTPNENDYRLLQWRAEEAVSRMAEKLGHHVSRTINNAPFDLWIGGARVEVKASTWRPWPQPDSNSGRYQAAIRNHQADIVVLDCINGTDHLHFIPQAAIGSVSNIAVWTYDPADSGGRWRPYLEAFDFLEQAIKAANHSWQPSLF
jgi:hypothetical protein